MVRHVLAVLRWCGCHLGLRNRGEAAGGGESHGRDRLVSFSSRVAGASTIAWHFYGGSYMVAALLTAIILWAGLTAARFITHDAFEGRPSSLTVLNIAHELVTLVIMGLIIGVWPPAGTV